MIQNIIGQVFFILVLSVVLLKTNQLMAPICVFLYQVLNYIVLILTVFSLRHFRTAKNPRWSFIKNTRDYFLSATIYEFILYTYNHSYLQDAGMSATKGIQHISSNLWVIILVFVLFVPIASIVESPGWKLFNFIGMSARSFKTWETLLKVIGDLEAKKIAIPLPHDVSSMLINSITLEG
jgi:hypothetical protein